jgi:hypothetical protein
MTTRLAPAFPVAHANATANPLIEFVEQIQLPDQFLEIGP